MTSINSIKKYTSKIQILIKKYDVDDLSDYDNIMKKLEDLSENTIKNFIASILWWNKNIKENIITGDEEIIDEEVIKKYKNKMLLITNANKEISGSGIATKMQEEKMIPWKQIIDIQKKMLKKDPLSLDTLIVSMYSLIPPRRLEFVMLLYIDKKNSKVFGEDDDTNYCVHTEKYMYFIINKFKMKHKMGSIKYILPHSLQKIIIDYVEHKKIKNGNPLFGISQESNLSKKLNEIFKKYSDKKKGFSVQMLRHSYSTYLYNNSKKLGTNEWEKIAKLMGHSHREHMEYSKHKSFDDTSSTFLEDMKDILNIKIIK